MRLIVWIVAALSAFSFTLLPPATIPPDGALPLAGIRSIALCWWVAMPVWLCLPLVRLARLGGVVWLAALSGLSFLSPALILDARFLTILWLPLVNLMWSSRHRISSNHWELEHGS